MDDSLRTQVLIVGAGPVGLTLAIGLAQRGIGVLVAEIRRVLNRTCIEDLRQLADGVRASSGYLDTGAAVEIRCDYLVGSDGARSEVRKKIGGATPVEPPPRFI